MNWAKEAAMSPYQTAVAVKQQIQSGDMKEADTGITELIDALAKSERRALKSQLVRLMAHIVKWRTQPERRNRSWAASIHGARDEISDIQEETPSITDAKIRELWNRCFKLAKEQAEAEMESKSAVKTLTWEEVFTAEYRV
ncbi:MAG TPA: DUF29 domain-containing protein [Planctomycetota bacterium]|nr:DUF29 domain-containing protein [Planctomycetota bacterium]